MCCIPPSKQNVYLPHINNELPFWNQHLCFQSERLAVWTELHNINVSCCCRKRGPHCLEHAAASRNKFHVEGLWNQQAVQSIESTGKNGSLFLREEQGKDEGRIRHTVRNLPCFARQSQPLPAKLGDASEGSMQSLLLNSQFSLLCLS